MKTGNVELRQEKQKFVPQQKDYSYTSKEEKDFRKPTYIGNNLVRFNNNVYAAVDGSEYKKKIAEWRKDTSLPIPVSRASTDYEQIFGEAEKNK
jgi:hypothetical protein